MAKKVAECLYSRLRMKLINIIEARKNVLCAKVVDSD